MQHGFWSRYSYITVAVGFDEHTVPQLRAAEALCRRSGKKLCLLHAVEPDRATLSETTLEAQHNPLWETRFAIETDARRVAMARLDEVESCLGSGVHVEKHVVVGRARDVIASEAFALGSCLIIVGLGYEAARFKPAVFSTGLSLLSASPMPVLAVDGARGEEVLPFRKMKVMLADDLSERSEATVAFAFDLAGSDTLTHLHVSGFTKDVLLATLSGAAAASHTAVDPEGLAVDVHAATGEVLRRRLELRASTYLEYFEEGGGTYRARLVEGIVEAELMNVVREDDPDVLVFGRHHRFAGRMPLKTMLAPGKPVVVVPYE